MRFLEDLWNFMLSLQHMDDDNTCNLGEKSYRRLLFQTLPLQKDNF